MGMDESAWGACQAVPGPDPAVLAQARLRAIWDSLVSRCTDPASRAYASYGGRGARVGFRDFGEFLDWSLRNGYEDGARLCRVGGDDNYEPGNCYWSPGSPVPADAGRGGLGQCQPLR
jgi:hypothetical protein